MDPRGNSVLPAGTQRGRRRVTVGTPRVLRPTRPAFRARSLRLPPAAAPSAGSLRPPPPPPSSAAAAAGKGAEETASLPLPTAHAHLRPTVRKSATSERRVARAPNVTGATRRGRGYGGSRGSRRRLAESAGVGLAVRPPVALQGSPRFSFSATRRRGAGPLRVGFVGPWGQRPNPRFPDSLPDPLREVPPARPSLPHPGLLFTPSPPDFLQFPERHVGGQCSIESAKVARTFLLVLDLPLSPAFESLNSFSL